MRFANTNPLRACRWLAVSLAVFLLGSFMPKPIHAQSVTTTTVQGTVYSASGAPASGTVAITWPAFTTNAGQAVAAGRTTVTIGADGFLSVNLAPNAGSQPAGLYYTAVYHLNDGATSTEYWTVPATAQATIAQIRAQVLPAAQAVQAVSKSYVDNAIQSLSQGALSSSGGALNGPLYLNGDPTAPTQAADKHYVDAQFAQALPLSGGSATGPLTATQLGAAYQVDQFPGTDFGARLQACVNNLSSASGGVCDARNFTGAVTMSANLTIATPNAAIYLPCATITTAAQLVVTAGTRNVAIHGCSFQGGSTASGTQGGTVWVYTGASNAFEIGDTTGASNTPGFWMHDVNINTANAGTAATGIYFERAQEVRLDGVYLNGNGGTGQTGVVLNGTGNYAGGTFLDVYINNFGTGWQLTGDSVGNYANASTFLKTHVVCPTSSGDPVAGTTGINLLEGDGNTWSGGDVEGCSTMFHLGAAAINNTIVGLRNENSTIQYQADAGSSFNSVLTGGTLYTGQLVDNGSRNSFSDAFHRASNGIKGDWYASQQDATVTNHQRLGTGAGNERGMLNEVQTDYGNRWLEGYSDAMGTGYQIWQLQDLVNNVNRFSIGQYLSGTANVVTNVVLNNGGCYTSNTPPTVTFSGGGGTGAAGTAVMTTTANPNCNSGAGYQVGSVTMTSGGSGYTSAPTVTFAGSNQVTAPNPTAEIVTAGGTNNQTVINAAGSGAIVLNGSTNAGTGGVVIGSGGTNNTTIATISGAGNAQFIGTLQVGGASQSGGTMSVRNNADAEVDYYLQPGATASQKGSFVYKDYNGASQWYMVKDQSNNWALNSAVGGLDSFKAYQSTNSGDTYVNASNTSGHIRLNYESGSGSETDIYSNGTLDASFLGPTGIKFPGIAASTSGSHSCLQVDSSGYLTNTGGACVTAAAGSSGQIAAYSSSGAVTGISTVPVASGGTGAATSAAALNNLGAQAAMPGVASDGANGLAVTGAVITPRLNNTFYVDGFTAGTWGGAWSSFTAYAPGATVTYNGNTYIAGAANTNIAPANGGTWFQVPSGAAVFSASLLPTALDVADAACLVNAYAHNQNGTLIFGANGVYATNMGLSLRAANGISVCNLIGSAGGVTEGRTPVVSGTTIRLTSAITNPAVNLANVNTALNGNNEFFTRITVRDLTIDANFNAPSAFDAAGMSGDIENVTGININGLDHSVSLNGYEIHARNLKVDQSSYVDSATGFGSGRGASFSALYGLDSIASTSGTGYTAGESSTGIIGGNCPTPPAVKITAVSSGIPQSYSITTAGRCILQPTGFTFASGSGASFSLLWNVPGYQIDYGLGSVTIPAGDGGTGFGTSDVFLSTVSSSGGSGYTAGETSNGIAGGSCSQAPAVTIASVNGSGAPTGYTINTAGDCVTAPTGFTFASGSGAAFSLGVRAYPSVGGGCTFTGAPSTTKLLPAASIGAITGGAITSINISNTGASPLASDIAGLSISCGGNASYPAWTLNANSGDSGQYFSSAPAPSAGRMAGGETQVFLQGYKNTSAGSSTYQGDKPCSTMPDPPSITLGAPSIGTGTTGGVVALTPGSNTGHGCMGTVDVAVTGYYPANYGIAISATDSTFDDLLVQLTGNIGVYVTGGNNTFRHPHCYTSQQICVVDDVGLYGRLSGNVYESVEADNTSHYAIELDGSGTMVTGTSMYVSGADIFPGVAKYHIGSGYGGLYATILDNGFIWNTFMPDEHNLVFSNVGPLDGTYNSNPLTGPLLFQGSTASFGSLATGFSYMGSAYSISNGALVSSGALYNSGERTLNGGAFTSPNSGDILLSGNSNDYLHLYPSSGWSSGLSTIRHNFAASASGNPNAVQDCADVSGSTFTDVPCGVMGLSALQGQFSDTAFGSASPVPSGGDLFEFLHSNVVAANVTSAGVVNAAAGFAVGGTPLASTNLGDGAAIPRYCGTATFSASTTSSPVACSWVTSSSHCAATWNGGSVSGGALGATAASGSVTLTAAASNSGAAAVYCSVN